MSVLRSGATAIFSKHHIQHPVQAILDTLTGQQTLLLQGGHNRELIQAIFSHDGSYIITVGNDSKLLRW